MAKSLVENFDQEENQDVPKVVFRHCYFSGQGQCRFDRDILNPQAQPIGATIRINDCWICNWHYENGHEQKIQNRLFKHTSNA